ncbi:hypothetical protein [Amycolatopsis sp. DG1A-15b]|uniref:hypothetical protein n=1 Tax=Amycolatopsis sp. DG1A-15b TaxID=3052846 RepID=UPI00255BB2E7|nr:hypothetical protein [Amycolatopsis sp. DG1A-15b]WIX85065.1 hypothetical protein QRY02_27950 [Amycolatopsis sp. DG1A-15b]
MARRAPRREQVTVAELLVRSDASFDRYRDEDTVVFPRVARHRERPQVLRSLTRVRMLSVVAGALALTGGVSAAVSMPSSRDVGAAWPPAGLEPPAVALVPLPADVVVPPAKHAPAPPVTPESVATPAEPSGISPVAVDPESDSVSPAVRRGTLARAVKIVDKVKTPVKAKPAPPAEQAAPVRHEIPDVPLWSRGRPGTPDWPAMWGGRRPAGFSFGEHHHGCGGGGGRHRR